MFYVKFTRESAELVKRMQAVAFHLTSGSSTAHMYSVT
jgi:hypothetical protein